MVFVLVGLGVAALRRGPRRLARGDRPPGRGRVAARVAGRVAVLVVVALGAWNLTHQPPAVHPDGGWPAGEARRRPGRCGAHGGRRRRDDVVDAALDPRLQVDRGGGLSAGAARPGGRGRDAARRGPGQRRPAPGRAGRLVLLCDDLFRDATGADCGGPAEDAGRRTRLARRSGRCSTGSRPRPDAGSSVYGPASADAPRRKCERRRPRRRRSLSPRPGRWRAIRVVPWVDCASSGRAPGPRCARTERTVLTAVAEAPAARAGLVADDGRACGPRRRPSGRRRTGARIARAPRSVDAARRVRADPAVGIRAAVAAHAHGKVVLHDLADLRLGQELVRAKRVLDAGGRVGRPGGDEPRYCGVSASSRSSRRPRASLVAVPRDGIRSPRISREIVE